MRVLLVLTLAFSISLISCSKDQVEKDIDKIEEWLDDNGLVAQSTDSGLHYIIEDEGTGTDFPNITSDVTVFYEGSLLDGTVFDGTTGTAATFNLLNVIPGWQEGIPLFKKGGSGTLIIPSSLGYGRSGAGGVIPPNAVLVFDIELVDFN